MRRDSGVVAILTAMLMLLFLGFCAFSVDVGHWYLVREQTQKAADAAALAAVVNLPDNFANAQATALQYASSNGLPAVKGTTTVTTTRDPVDTGRLSVTVSTTVSNFFTGLFGIGTTTISSTGSAAYLGPVKMGSPCNRLGSDPDKQKSSDSPTCDTATGRLWVNLNAPGTAKQEGDPYTATRCTGVEDVCAGDGTNLEHRTTGYVFDVTVKQAGPLRIELFDAPWVDVGAVQGNQCNSAPLAGLKPTPADPTRYASGSTSAYCTGDSTTLPSGTPTASVMNTTFVLRSAAGSPLSPESHDELPGCRRTYGGYRPPSAAAFSSALSPGSPGYVADLAQSFRKWSTLCSLPSVQPGTYVLQVLSSDDVAAGNRFAVRAVGSGDSSSVTLAGHGVLDLFANDSQAGSRFYLARTPSSAAGQTLHVRFFDAGECSTPCTLTLLAPGGGTATGCTTTTKGLTGIVGCSFTPDAAYNGRWVDLVIPIPSTYSCADSDPGACWFRAKYVGGAPHDVTAWSAEMDGQPVRLTP